MAIPLSCATVCPFSATKPLFRRSSCHRNASMAIVKAAADERPSVQPAAAPAGMALSRRLQLAALLAAAGVAQQNQAAQAIGFKKELKKRRIPAEDYNELPANPALRYIDLAPGSGPEVAAGATVTVHFDCIYKGIDAVSSRSARVLSGNRTLAEPYEFIAGGKLSDNRARKVNDGAGGLFTGFGGPKPPPALAAAVLGMRQGGRRRLLVPPELGYGDKGEQEIPPGASFELQVEVLSVRA